jgi:hypothetical protein
MLYHKDELSRDDGGFGRYLGRTADGKQAKFRLGADENKSRLAAAQLSLLWTRLESQGKNWGHATLLLAKAIAKGQMEVTLSHPHRGSRNIRRLGDGPQQSIRGHHPGRRVRFCSWGLLPWMARGCARPGSAPAYFT